MIEAWRIVHARRAPSAFDGEGARLFGGRWNTPGLPAVYTAESRALAILEWMVHISPLARSLPLTLFSVNFTDKLVHTLKPNTIPLGFLANTINPATQAIGDAWLRRQMTPVLRVPSAIIPGEFNYILNPRHPHFAQIIIGKGEPFCLDSRLAYPTG